MPCYDGIDNERTRIIYESGVSPNELEREKDRSSRLEAALCAIFNELDRREIAESVIAESSRKGLIDIMRLWVRHKKTDVARLTKEIHGYSVDEQEIIKKILET